MSSLPADDSQSAERLHGVLLAFLEELEAGHAPDREILYTEYPDLRDELTMFFTVGDALDRLSGPLRLITGNESGIVPSGSGHHTSPCIQARRDVTGRTADDRSDRWRLGDFLIRRIIGRGGMGVVYKAEQCSNGKRVALKVLPHAAAVDPRQLQRFRNEATAAAQLDHRNIVPVLEVGEEAGIHYFAMQYIDGLSLIAVIRLLRRMNSERVSMSAASHALSAPPERSQPSDGSIPMPDQATGERILATITHLRAAGGRAWSNWVARLGRDVAVALECAHRTGVVHRDITPGN